MLQNTALVRRRALERLYTGRCTIFVQQAYTKQNGATGHGPVAVATDLPCRLSFKTSSPADSRDGVATTAQEVKLFLAPEQPVPAGCKLAVTQDGVTTDYAASGPAPVHSTHQEVPLKLFEEYA